MIDSGRGFLADTILFLVFYSPTIDQKEVATLSLMQFIVAIIFLKMFHLISQIRVTHMYDTHKCCSFACAGNLGRAFEKAGGLSNAADSDARRQKESRPGEATSQKYVQKRAHANSPVGGLSGMLHKC